MPRGVRVALAVCAIAACAPPGVARASSWSVDKGSGPSRIALEPCLRFMPTATDADELLRHRHCIHSGDAVGRLTLIVRNAGSRSVRVRVRYARADGHFATMPGNSSIALLWSPRAAPPHARDAALRQSGGKIGEPKVIRALGTLSTLGPRTGGSFVTRLHAARGILARHRRPTGRDLDRLAAVFTRLVAAPGSGTVLTRADALDLLRGADDAIRRQSLTRLIAHAYAVAVARSAVLVASHSAVPLALRFRLPAERSPSLLTGVVEVRELGSTAPPVSVPVTADAPHSAISLEPAAVALESVEHERATISLVGPDASGFAIAGRRSSHVTLSAEHGRKATINIGEIVPDPRNRDRSTLIVSVADGADPGEYHDRIALIRSAGGGPKLTLTVRAGRSLAGGAALVVLGCLAGAIFALLVAGTAWLSFGSLFRLAVTGLSASALAATVFALAIHGPIWGTRPDQLKAFGLGFGTAAALALLFVPSRTELSIRNRYRYR
jgi:hypothetical protein